MGSRFVKTYEADRRAIELHLQLRAIEKLPRVTARVSKDRKSIIIIDKSDPASFNEVSVGRVLSFDVDAARANGGTREALMISERKTPIPIPSTELQDAVDDFLVGGEAER
jgi:hypothetical protein